MSEGMSEVNNPILKQASQPDFLNTENPSPNINTPFVEFGQTPELKKEVAPFDDSNITNTVTTPPPSVKTSYSNSQPKKGWGLGLFGRREKPIQQSIEEFLSKVTTEATTKLSEKTNRIQANESEIQRMEEEVRTEPEKIKNLQAENERLKNMKDIKGLETAIEDFLNKLKEYDIPVPMNTTTGGKTRKHRSKKSRRRKMPKARKTRHKGG
uniref:Uncharacterized protein n=1 Tax=viral metagenome TaxID=1070528 RepID=A0A6C0HS06_9ZZZZ